MSAKREHDEEGDSGEMQEHDAKRAKKQDSKFRQHQSAAVDPTWGQRSVFGSGFTTSIPAGEEDDYEDDADAMAYLASVRQEASAIPHLLVAPKVQIGPQMPAGFRKRQRADDDTDADEGEASEDDEYGEVDELDQSFCTNGFDDAQGYYEDGAYIGAPEDEQEDAYEDGEAIDEEDEEATERALHGAYFASLMDRYLRLRALLHSPPPPAAAARLPASHPTHVPGFGRNSSTTGTWARLLRTTDPLPAQLAAMPKDAVLRVLRVLLGGAALRQGRPVPERTSRWLWGLLARLPERGALNHAEIAWVRDLGRRAVLLGRSLAEMAALREELADGGLGVHEGVDGSSSDEDFVDGANVETGEGAESADGDVTDDAAPGAGSTNGDVAGDAAPPAPGHDRSEPEEAYTAPGNADEGTIDENVAMDMASESDDAEEGEASDHDAEQDLQDAKSRLMAQLGDGQDPPPSEEELAQEAARLRARMNMRATLSMILTVAGEFYGQRDLLEFREPFVGM